MTDLADRLQIALGGADTLERELVGGGMSRVFVATEAALGRKVVIKVLPPELATATAALFRCGRAPTQTSNHVWPRRADGFRA
jgi:hypothetical protein